MFSFSLSAYDLNEAVLSKMNFSKNEGMEKRYWVKLKAVLGVVQQSCNWDSFCLTKYYILRMPKDFHWIGGIDYNQELKMSPFKVFLSLKKTLTSPFKFQMEWQSKVNLFSWNCQDLRYSRLLERHPIINPALMKRMDLGHDPEPIVVNGRLFPLTSSGFGSGLYFLKWINSQQNLR